MRRVFDLGRILPPLCRPAPPPLLPDLFPDASAWGPPRRGPPPAARTPTARCLPEWPLRGVSTRLFCGGRRASRQVTGGVLGDSYGRRGLQGRVG